MDKLPEALVFQILSRLDDSADVARCQVAWKTFHTVSPDLRSINLRWPLQRYIELRSRVSNASSSSPLTSPLKTIFLNLISNSRVLESVHISVENFPLDVSITDVQDNGDDLYLNDWAFVKEWLPRVSGALKSLSISDFWVQSCWRQSEVLSMVSACCHKLLELEVKNAWLSLENLNPMPMLTSLTLERIRLDDNNDISQVNKCLPNLQVLNLIDIEGLELPVIRLINLKTCHWTVGWSSVTLITPNLITLRLECIRLAALYVQAPMLSHFHLALDYAGAFFVKEFENLRTLLLESSYMYSLIIKFPRIETIENLTLNSRDSHIRSSKFTLKNLLAGFRTVTSLCLNSRAWTELETCYDPFNRVDWEGRNGLKTFRGYLLLVDPSLTFTLVAWLLDQCFNLVDVSLLIHRNVAPHVSRGFIVRCMARWPNVNWRWECGKKESKILG
ncbi:hypothetical protein L2E82_39374 [Cichorium intybus]|uniref:Uncharacterized protein n=1 Tax=Cichorium intybus TaxID=13427 RepID=A0ACB9AJR9_CICIN|nr:hypothetical protein L2E82_39374 [Cichorium intybus]